MAKFFSLTKIMNDPILVITDTVMIHKESHSLIVQKQSHDITQTVTQISWALSSTAHNDPQLIVEQLPGSVRIKGVAWQFWSSLISSSCGVVNFICHFRCYVVGDWIICQRTLLDSKKFVKTEREHVNKNAWYITWYKQTKRARGLSPGVHGLPLPFRTVHYIHTYTHTLPMRLGTTPFTI